LNIIIASVSQAPVAVAQLESLGDFRAMPLKRSVKVVLWSLSSLIATALLAFFAFAGCLATHYWWDRDQWNLEKIGKAYIHFYAEKTNFPASMADLVDAGYLPESAEWYREPPGMFPHPVNFKESSYIVRPPESGNVENLGMVGRRTKRDGKEEVDFSPPANADVRDAIKHLQQKPEFKLIWSQPQKGDK